MWKPFLRLECDQEGPDNSETKYNVFLIPVSIRYISYSKDMNERGQHTESGHWAYTVKRATSQRKHKVHYVTGAVFVEEVFDLSTRIGACSEKAGERTVCTTLLADSC